MLAKSFKGASILSIWQEERSGIGGSKVALMLPDGH